MYFCMLKNEFVYRELLFQAFENSVREFTQKALSVELGLSLSHVNHALKPLKRMGAIKIRPQGLVLVNPKKVLLYWCSVRNVQKDIVYSTRVDASVREIEKSMPQGTVFTAYSGFKFAFNETPSDYSVVYVYAGNIAEIKKRFPEKSEPFNLIVLQADSLLKKYGKKISLAQLFVDLWSLPEWFAKDYLKAMEEKLYGLLE